LLTLGTGVAIFADVNVSSVEFVAVELLDGALGVCLGFKDNDSGTSRTTIWTKIDI
jgi:hypothetical protein